MGPFRHTIPVRFHQVDSAGIVFFARYFEYAHDAYEAWLRSLGHPLDLSFAERGYGLPLVHAEADFHHPVRLGQEVEAELAPVRLGTSSLRVETRLRLRDGTALATVTTVHVCVDPATGRPRPFPEGLLARLREAIA